MVVENTHRYLQIAFAEELYLYCQANNISFPELRDALNTKWNVEILRDLYAIFFNTFDDNRINK